jgi:hypothetical protein
LLVDAAAWMRTSVKFGSAGIFYCDLETLYSRKVLLKTPSVPAIIQIYKKILRLQYRFPSFTDFWNRTHA